MKEFQFSEIKDILGEINPFLETFRTIKEEFSEVTKNTDYNTEITDIENKIPSITGLVTTTALNARDIQIPDITNLATKADLLKINTALNTKTAETENKIPDTSHFINTPEFNRLTKISFDARMKEVEKSHASKSEVSNALVLGNKNRKNIEKLRTFDSSYFFNKIHFQDDGMQNDLVFQAVFKYFKITTNSDIVIEWESKDLSKESIKPPATAENSLNP